MSDTYVVKEYGIGDKKLWQAGRDYENKRIIELLESKLCSCVTQPNDYNFADRAKLMQHIDCDYHAMIIEYHVSLIKGEQK